MWPAECASVKEACSPTGSVESRFKNRGCRQQRGAAVWSWKDSFKSRDPNKQPQGVWRLVTVEVCSSVHWKRASVVAHCFLKFYRRRSSEPLESSPAFANLRHPSAWPTRRLWCAYDHSAKLLPLREPRTLSNPGKCLLTNDIFNVWLQPSEQNTYLSGLLTVV